MKNFLKPWTTLPILLLTTCMFDLGEQTIGYGRGHLHCAAKFHYTLTEEYLSDIRMSVEFEPESGVPKAKQTSIRNGSLLAIRIWESVIPDMRVRLVSADSSPNLRFIFGDFRRPRQPDCCQLDFDWTGISSWPTAAGHPTRTEIYFNTFGRGIFAFEDYHYVSRRTLYDSYVPASYPPEYYQGLGKEPGNPGHLNGRFHYAPGKQIGDYDITAIAFHEFAHSLGIRHRPTSASECRAWYAGDPDSVPRVINRDYPDLKRSWVGGGVYDWRTGEFTSKFRVSLRGDHVLAQTHMPGSPDNCSELEPGVPQPPYGQYNNRVVFADDVARLPPDLRTTWPEAGALIRLRKPDGSKTSTSNWREAITLMQLDKHEQEDPWFVTAVEPLPVPLAKSPK